MVAKIQEITGEIQELVVKVLVVDNGTEYSVELDTESVLTIDVSMIGAIGSTLVKQMQETVKNGRKVRDDDPRTKGQLSYLDGADE